MHFLFSCWDKVPIEQPQGVWKPNDTQGAIRPVKWLSCWDYVTEEGPPSRLWPPQRPWPASRVGIAALPAWTAFPNTLDFTVMRHVDGLGKSCLLVTENTRSLHVRREGGTQKPQSAQTPRWGLGPPKSWGARLTDQEGVTLFLGPNHWRYIQPSLMAVSTNLPFWLTPHCHSLARRGGWLPLVLSLPHSVLSGHHGPNVAETLVN